MVERVQLEILISKIRSLSASDMRDVAHFGKIKGYSSTYLGLKESLRAMAAMAHGLYGFDLESEITSMKPIVFRGMVPSDVFLDERDRLAAIGDELIRRLSDFGHQSKVVSFSDHTHTELPHVSIQQPMLRPMPSQQVSSAPALPQHAHAQAGGMEDPSVRLGAGRGVQHGRQQRRVYLSKTFETATTLDLKRCLVTADCEPFEERGLTLVDPKYDLINASNVMKQCSGALICLVSPPMSDAADLLNGMPKVAQLDVSAAKTSSALSISTDDDPYSNVVGPQFQPVRKGLRVAKPLPAFDDEARNFAIQNALTELGVALSLFPGWVFFAVQDTLVNELPASYQRFISFKLSGDQLSFEDGQALVDIFKKANRDSR